MATITLNSALTAISAQQKSTSITPSDVEHLLSTVNGTTFANFTSVTDVKTAAAHKSINIKKVTVANVQLFNGIKDFTNVWEAAVKRSAEKLGVSSQADIDNFSTQDTYYSHTNCFSVVKHKEKDEYYLYAIYNGASSAYVINGELVDKEVVAQYLTPSAAKELLNPSDTVVNKANNVEHKVVIRTPKLSNIVDITASKQNITI